MAGCDEALNDLCAFDANAESVVRRTAATGPTAADEANTRAVTRARPDKKKARTGAGRNPCGAMEETGSV